MKISETNYNLATTKQKLATIQDLLRDVQGEVNNEEFIKVFSVIRSWELGIMKKLGIEPVK